MQAKNARYQADKFLRATAATVGMFAIDSAVLATGGIAMPMIAAPVGAALTAVEKSFEVVHYASSAMDATRGALAMIGIRNLGVAKPVHSVEAIEHDPRYDSIKHGLDKHMLVSSAKPGEVPNKAMHHGVHVH